MAIERKNSFHLLLSDDELQLTKLLAEKEGLNASDYLRALVRRAANMPGQLTQVLRLQETMGKEFGDAILKQMFEGRGTPLTFAGLPAVEAKGAKTTAAAKAKPPKKK